MHNATVVSNSSPLISLFNIGRLELLQMIYGRIIVPQGVYEEVFGEGKMQDIEWLTVKRIKDLRLQKYLSPLLHKGEAEVIVLAKEINADLAIIDDYLARKYAQYLGLTITGTLGVIVKAKRRGFINRVKPLLDELIERDSWIDNKLYLTMLNIAGERNG